MIHVLPWVNTIAQGDSMIGALLTEVEGLDGLDNAGLAAAGEVAATAREHFGYDPGDDLATMLAEGEPRVSQFQRHVSESWGRLSLMAVGRRRYDPSLGEAIVKKEAAFKLLLREAGY